MNRKTARAGRPLALLLLAMLTLDGCARERALPAAPPALMLEAEMSFARASHQAVLLHNGQVLVTGGCGGDGCATVYASSELYDAERRRFVGGVEMSTPRAGHAAVRLDDGDVLVVGGWNGQAATDRVERYDSAASVFREAGVLSLPRITPSLTVLANGAVLVGGGEVSTGRATSALERYDPELGAFSAMPALQESRAFHSATRLLDGRVLFVGGHRGRGDVLRSAEIFDPETGHSSPTGALSVPRYKHAAVLLADGRVLVIGGSAAGPRDTARHASTEIYDVTTGTFSSGPALRAPRYKIPDAAVVTEAGDVIVAGGAEQVEVWPAGKTDFAVVPGRFGRTVEFPTATLLRDGDLLIVGGYDEAIEATRQAWRLDAGLANDDRR